jgi:hypothetical protein
MTVGMNVDPNNPCAAPPAERLLQSGFHGVRLTARANDVNRKYIDDMLAAGLQVVAVVGTGDNAGFIPPQKQVILQIYNEPDAASGSTFIPSVAYAGLYAAWRAKCDGYTCWTAGFVSGDPDYYRQFLNALWNLYEGLTLPGVVVPNAPNLKNVLRFPEAVAIHPYLANPVRLKTLAEACWNIGIEVTGAGIPVVATEWFQQANQNPANDPIAPFQAALNNPDPDGVCTTWNSFFGWCSNMSDLPGAVVSPDGTCLLEGRRLIDAIGGDAGWCP